MSPKMSTLIKECSSPKSDETEKIPKEKGPIKKGVIEIMDQYLRT